MPGRIRKIVASIFMALSLSFPAVSLPAVKLEYQVKASYLYNFMRFITWPSDVFSTDGKFYLCVSGAESLGKALDAIAGERVEGREIVIRRLEQGAQARAARCHMLFLGSTDVPDIGAERGMLTVGETPGFLARGGIINFIMVQNRVRFEINQPAAQKAGLVISSRLLDLAR